MIQQLKNQDTLQKKESLFNFGEAFSYKNSQTSPFKNNVSEIFKRSFIDNSNIFTSKLKVQIPLFERIQKKKIKKLWSKQEDKLLRLLVQQKGAKQWAYISSHFKDRCGKQCRQRWHNHLRNGILKGQWTTEEQWILFLGVYAYGKRWSIISKILKGRTQNTLKNHWNCKMKPKKFKLYNKMHRILYSQFTSFHLNPIQQRLLKEIKINLDLKKQDDYEKQEETIKKMLKTIKQFMQLKASVQSCNYLNFKFQNYQSPDKNYNLLNNFQTFGKKKIDFDKTVEKTQQKMNQQILKQEYFSQNQQFDIAQYSNEIFVQNDSNNKQQNQKSEGQKSSNNEIQCYFQSPKRQNSYFKINLQESHKKK